jgi:hypothetical protein
LERKDLSHSVKGTVAGGVSHNHVLLCFFYY